MFDALRAGGHRRQRRTTSRCTRSRTTGAWGSGAATFRGAEAYYARGDQPADVRDAERRAAGRGRRGAAQGARMRLAVIPARGGSKRIPRKNMRPFAGKPIIATSIDAARACGLFDQVVVSTDDEEIAEVAREPGRRAPFMRPAGVVRRSHRHDPVWPRDPPCSGSARRATARPGLLHLRDRAIRGAAGTWQRGSIAWLRAASRSPSRSPASVPDPARAAHRRRGPVQPSLAGEHRPPFAGSRRDLSRRRAVLLGPRLDDVVLYSARSVPRGGAMRAPGAGHRHRGGLGPRRTDVRAECPTGPAIRWRCAPMRRRRSAPGT